MLINERATLASLLQTTADTLDIPDHVYEDATLKYQDVCEHLGAEDSDLRQNNPQLYVQGSFRLGTVVQPIHKNDEYDIDLVCRLEIAKESITQKELKQKIGGRLKAREDLAKILNESRRCWVLDYPNEKGMLGFHMDVLPSIPNKERLPAGLLLTDKELTRWQKSNPIEYSDWFKVKMGFDMKKAAIAASRQVSIEEVPDWQVKTSLQRSVQILKRHRDIYFANKPEIRPISIILTTLAAHAYQGQEDIFEALTSITTRMPLFIKNENGKWVVKNPVDDENFADKWNAYPERREAFFSWLKKVEKDFADLQRADSLEEGVTVLEKSLGSGTMTKVAVKLGAKPTTFLPALTSPIDSVPALSDGHHAQKPQWPIIPKYKVKLSAATYFKMRDGKKGPRMWAVHSDRPIHKKVWLRFIAETNTQEPYSIKWQVVNTGQDASQAGQLRGEFYESEAANKHIRWETTLFRGTHWVEAFVIKNGECVARSGRFFVKVR